MENEGQSIETMNYEKNLQKKLKHRGFLSDPNPLLPADATYDIQDAYELIKKEIVDSLNER